MKHANSNAAARFLGARTPLDLSKAKDTVSDKSVLVTGGGGSIGSALSRKLSNLGASRIWAIDSSEHALANLLSLSNEFEREKLQEVLADVRDRDRMDNILRKYRPQLVFHAAALKHIHLGDRHPTECVLTNLVGLRNALDASDAHGASQFVFISSDKAAAPTSVMGACKRLAEIYIQGRNLRTTGLRALTVRFGNVFGSQGSVTEIFERQIKSGGPLTLTHRDMKRYFMTIDQAVELILLGVARTTTAHDTFSYLLDMGAPVKILDLARYMIEASGRDIAIQETGAREGEKLDELLHDEHEVLHQTEVRGLLAIQSHTARPITDDDIDQLEAIARSGDEALTRKRVSNLIHDCLGGEDTSYAVRPAMDFGAAAARGTSA